MATSLSVAIALIALLVFVPSTAAGATVVSAWRAKIGTGGINGVATVQGYASGTGVIVLKLARLRPATTVPVTLYKGTCASVGAVLIRLPTIRSTGTGTAARTSSLTAAQLTLIRSATKGTGKFALRVGSAATGGIKCGLFAALAVPPVVTATVTVGRAPTAVAVAPNGVWVANYYDGTLTRIDPATNSALSTIDVSVTENLAPWALTYAEGSLWVAAVEYDTAGTTKTGTSLLRIDPASGQSLATIKLGKDVTGIAASPGAVWVSSFDDGTVSRIDTATNQLATTITLSTGLNGIAYDYGSVWVANEQSGAVSRIDPATNQVAATITTVGSPEGVTTGAGAVWVTNWGTTGLADGVLSRIDPATNQVVRTIPLGTNPWPVTFGGGYVWAALTGAPTVVQVNAATNAVVARVTTGQPVTDPNGGSVGLMGIAATDRTVWVVQPLPGATADAPPDPGKVIRIDH